METNDTLESVVPESSPERVGFGKRFGAYLIDFILGGILGGILGSMYGPTLTEQVFGSTMDDTMIEIEALGIEGMEGIFESMINTIAGVTLVVFVFMLLDAFLGQTIGKMILGIKNGDESGTNANLGKLILRAVVKYINTLLGLLAGLTGLTYLDSIGGWLGFAVFIGFFFVLGEKRQGFHDMLAKTAVFNKSDLK